MKIISNKWSTQLNSKQFLELYNINDFSAIILYEHSHKTHVWASRKGDKHSITEYDLSAWWSAMGFDANDKNLYATCLWLPHVHFTVLSTGKQRALLLSRSCTNSPWGEFFSTQTQKPVVPVETFPSGVISLYFSLWCILRTVLRAVYGELLPMKDLTWPNSYQLTHLCSDVDCILWRWWL